MSAATGKSGEGRGWWPLIGAIACIGLVSATDAARAGTPASLPHYEHVFVIVEENKDFELIIDPKVAPNIARLAKTYGVATTFYGEVHPSEANYVAMLGGDTLGIHDDDPFYCRPASTAPLCAGAARPGYTDHSSDAPHLGDQLQARGMTWKAYLESLPEPGSLAVNAADPKYGVGPPMNLIYASKHAGFVNFRSVQNDPHRGDRLVGFDQLDADIAANRLPSFGLVVPNQCNEMHGLYGLGVVADCDITKPLLTVARGDRVVGDLVARLMATKAWRSKGNMAIVITFDESGTGKREGCCAVTPDAASNFGGGHIITVVATNHGPRGVTDSTPYNHYSLLRTFEDAFGIDQYLGHAADTDKGVVSMTDLFALTKGR